ncbi:GRIM-19 protein [Conidiobolus coronatus NRRL 28638]|jgi:NADH dehydrogenase (ubiquinone) 1 alpha subcomplex subunit 13|uniref:NADH dehydrogenase [ubiquinone] 1 alpha subcomplex subunit 13 n=1 Tax=Conidiobolus coronatus (strain ATCC 28846 / CBS 209.66 / NRRL 28638) TaxID=796925 RepID=A0A137NYU7_CONC2|nr:GRIM-19 protein [Conidiobolus coronatus NRRL 28638]|eukprot:KXN68003.1 GRIM-19 protein [Conidiobolus coronatus NRRL 28638]
MTRQDMPPRGGFPTIRVDRNLPKSRLTGLGIFGGVIALSIYGFHRVLEGKIERKEINREKVWARINLVPLLEAESDRDKYRRGQAALAREAEIMKGVPGWKVGQSVYNTDKYVAPSVYIQ